MVPPEKCPVPPMEIPVGMFPWRPNDVDSYYIWIMKAAFKRFVEQKKEYECPNLASMIDMAQQVVDKAPHAKFQKAAFRRLRKAALGVGNCLRKAVSTHVIKSTCGEALTALHLPLSNALEFVNQYSGDSWADRKFLLSAEEFGRKFEPLLPALEGGEKRLVANIKIVMDAVKAGTISVDDGSDLEGEGLTAARLKVHEAIMEAGGVDSASAVFVDEGRAEIVADLRAAGQAVEEDLASVTKEEDSVASDHDISNVQAALKNEKEAGTGRKPKYQGDRVAAFFREKSPQVRAFKGKFWDLAKIADEAGEPTEMEGMGQTYGPLHQAVLWEDYDGVCLLTGRGGNVDVQMKRICPTLGFARGSTPLHLAAIIGDERIVKQLILDGANVEATDDAGKTPSQQATTDECKALIEGAESLRALQVQLGEHVAAGRWAEAMDIIYGSKGRPGLPANTLLPSRPSTEAFPEGVDYPDRYCAIHAACRQGKIEEYVKLVYAGALPLQALGHLYVDGVLSVPKMPSQCCDDSDEGKEIKPLVELIEQLLAPGETEPGEPNFRYLVAPRVGPPMPPIPERPAGPADP